MSCRDCGQDILSDGVCVDCSDKRFNDYPRLKKLEERLDKRINECNKQRLKIEKNGGSLLYHQEFVKERNVLEKIKEET